MKLDGEGLVDANVFKIGPYEIEKNYRNAESREQAELTLLIEDKVTHDRMLFSSTDAIALYEKIQKVRNSEADKGLLVVLLDHYFSSDI
jgi:hypothetical protein